MKRKSAFDRCVESVSTKGSADDPRAVCAVAGRRKYGQAEMTRRAIAEKRRKRNPIESAAELSEAFHGRPAETVTEYVDTLHEHSTLTGLGRLLSIKLKGGVKISFDKDTQLASNEAGTQLYIVGGDQTMDLDGFDVDPTKEAVVLGQVTRLDYQTAKHHLGRTDKTPGPYTHQLGEETGSLPILMYDTVNRQLSFVGGSYHIDVDMDGKYSAGIRD